MMFTPMCFERCLRQDAVSFLKYTITDIDSAKLRTRFVSSHLKSQIKRPFSTECNEAVFYLWV